MLLIRRIFLKLTSLSLKAKPLFTRGRNSAVRNKDGWLVVYEYESDDLASRFEDEKKLRKAKESASRKRKAKFDGRRNEDKKPQYAADNQLFRGEFLHAFAFHAFTLSPLLGFCLGGTNHILVLFFWVF